MDTPTVGDDISRSHNGSENSINIIQRVQYYLHREITYGYDGEMAKKLEIPISQRWSLRYLK